MKVAQGRLVSKAGGVIEAIPDQAVTSSRQTAPMCSAAVPADPRRGQLSRQEMLVIDMALPFIPRFRATCAMLGAGNAGKTGRVVKED